MRKPAFMQPRILKQAILSALSPAYTTRFPAEPFIPQEAFRGRPRFNADECIGSGACAQVCPPKCIDVIDDLEASPPVRRLVQHFDSCIVCGQCERYCQKRANSNCNLDRFRLIFPPVEFHRQPCRSSRDTSNAGIQIAVAGRDNLSEVFHIASSFPDELVDNFFDGTSADVAGD